MASSRSTGVCGGPDGQAFFRISEACAAAALRSASAARCSLRGVDNALELLYGQAADAGAKA